MKKFLNLLVTGFFIADSLLMIPTEKPIKTIGDFDGDGTKEVATYSPGKIKITSGLISEINGVDKCDSLFVIPNGKKDCLGIHYDDGTMQKAEYSEDFWSRVPYKK